MKKTIKTTSLFLCFFMFNFLYAACSDTADVCLSLNDENLNYSSTVDIAGFQFNHDNCATGASGGDAGANGFTVSASSGVVLGFSFTGSYIPAGSGTLLENVNCDTIDGLVFSGTGGNTLNVELDMSDEEDSGGGFDCSSDVCFCSVRVVCFVLFNLIVVVCILLCCCLLFCHSD